MASPSSRSSALLVLEDLIIRIDLFPLVWRYYLVFHLCCRLVCDSMSDGIFNLTLVVLCIVFAIFFAVGR